MDISNGIKDAGVTYEIRREGDKEWLVIQYEKIPEGFTEETFEAFCHAMVANWRGQIQ